LQHLGKHNAVDNYLLEVARLKAGYNPFKKIPNGHIFIINVGANSSSPLQSPLFDNDKFEFVPIPGNFNERFTYADLRQFNEPGKPMLDLFSKTSIIPQKNVHNDPEFVTMTYGDNIKWSVRQISIVKSVDNMI
jgi:hypothetical protein